MRPEVTQSDSFPTIPQAAKRLGIGRRQLNRAIDAGDVAVYQVGGWRRVRWESVIRWIESQRVPVSNHARARVDEVLEREDRAGAG
jgi:excisionase family DNA binding protein